MGPKTGLTPFEVCVSVKVSKSGVCLCDLNIAQGLLACLGR